MITVAREIDVEIDFHKRLVPPTSSPIKPRSWRHEKTFEKFPLHKIRSWLLASRTNWDAVRDGMRKLKMQLLYRTDPSPIRERFELCILYYHERRWKYSGSGINFHKCSRVSSVMTIRSNEKGKAQALW